MNEQTKGNTMYERFSTVAELNKAPGFDPLRFARKVVQNGGEKLLLDLKYKKLWFRLRYPQGRIKVTPLKITEQLAIIEAKVFFDRGDNVPAASFIAQRYAKDTPGGLYIESAQHMAVDTALNDAGFGVQLISAGEQPPAKATTPAETAPVEMSVAAATPPIAVETIATPPVVAPVVQTPSRAQSTAPMVQEQSSHQPPVAEPIAEVAAVANDNAPSTVETPVAEAVAAPVVTAVTPSMPDAETASAEMVTPALEERETTVADATVAETEAAAPTVMEAAPAVETVSAETPAAAIPVLTVAETAAEAVDEAVEANVPLTGSYTADMAVDDICTLMTLEEAREVIVDIGTCNGWTMAQVADRRPASLKWYLSGYSGENNILKAAAKLILDNGIQNKAS